MLDLLRKNSDIEEPKQADIKAAAAAGHYMPFLAEWHNFSGALVVRYIQVVNKLQIGHLLRFWFQYMGLSL